MYKSFFAVNYDRDSLTDKSQELMNWVEINGLDLSSNKGNTLIKWLF